MGGDVYAKRHNHNTGSFRALWRYASLRFRGRGDETWPDTAQFAICACRRTGIETAVDSSSDADSAEWTRIMTTDATAYKAAAYPQTPWFHVSDEDIAAALDTSARHSKAAHKAAERKRQKQAEQGAQMERETQA